jgi:hypothetical protein
MRIVKLFVNIFNIFCLKFFYHFVIGCRILLCILPPYITGLDSNTYSLDNTSGLFIDMSEEDMESYLLETFMALLYSLDSMLAPEDVVRYIEGQYNITFNENLLEEVLETLLINIEDFNGRTGCDVNANVINDYILLYYGADGIDETNTTLSEENQSILDFLVWILFGFSFVYIYKRICLWIQPSVKTNAYDISYTSPFESDTVIFILDIYSIIFYILWFILLYKISRK